MSLAAQRLVGQSQPMRELRALTGPQAALANHLVMGPVILARGLAVASHAARYSVAVRGLTPA